MDFRKPKVKVNWPDSMPHWLRLPLLMIHASVENTALALAVMESEGSSQYLEGYRDGLIDSVNYITESLNREKWG